MAVSSATTSIRLVADETKRRLAKSTCVKPLTRWEVLCLRELVLNTIENVSTRIMLDGDRPRIGSLADPALVLSLGGGLSPAL